MVNAKVESALQLFWVKCGCVSHEGLILQLSHIVDFHEVLMKRKILSHPGLKASQVFFCDSFLSEPMLKPPLIDLFESFQIMQSDPFLMMIDRVNNVLVSFALNIGWLGYPIFEGTFRPGYLISINGSYNVNGSEVIIIFGALMVFIFLSLLPKLFDRWTLFQSLGSFNLQFLLVFH